MHFTKVKNRCSVLHVCGVEQMWRQTQLRHDFLTLGNATALSIHHVNESMTSSYSLLRLRCLIEKGNSIWGWASVDFLAFAALSRPCVKMNDRRPVSWRPYPLVRLYLNRGFVYIQMLSELSWTEPNQLCGLSISIPLWLTLVITCRLQCARKYA